MKVLLAGFVNYIAMYSAGKIWGFRVKLAQMGEIEDDEVRCDRLLSLVLSICISVGLLKKGKANDVVSPVGESSKLDNNNTNVNGSKSMANDDTCKVLDGVSSSSVKGNHYADGQEAWISDGLCSLEKFVISDIDFIKNENERGGSEGKTAESSVIEVIFASDQGCLTNC